MNSGPEPRPVVALKDSLFFFSFLPPPRVSLSLLAEPGLDANLESCLSQLFYSIYPPSSIQFILQGVFSLFHAERMDIWNEAEQQGLDQGQGGEGQEVQKQWER